MRLNTSLVVGAFSLVLIMCGCTASQTPARDEEQRRADEQRGADEQRRTEEQRRTGDRPREDHDAPCPAGEHRYTNPNSGVVSCVRD